MVAGKKFSAKIMAVFTALTVFATTVSAFPGLGIAITLLVLWLVTNVITAAINLGDVMISTITLFAQINPCIWAPATGICQPYEVKIFDQIIDISMPVDPGIRVINYNLIRMFHSFYFFAIMALACYIIFMSGSPGGRVKAKDTFIRMVFGMLLVSNSPAIFQFMLDIVRLITDQIIDMGVSSGTTATSMTAMFSHPKHICTILIFAVVSSIAAMIGAVRYFLVYIMASFFPLTLFLYYTDIPNPLFSFKSIGLRLWKFTMLLLMIQILQCLFLAAAMIMSAGGAGYHFIDFLLMIGAYIGFVLTPMIGMQMLAWVGAVVHLTSSRPSANMSRFVASWMRTGRLSTALSISSGQYMVGHNMGEHAGGATSAAGSKGIESVPNRGVFTEGSGPEIPYSHEGVAGPSGYSPSDASMRGATGGGAGGGGSVGSSVAGVASGGGSAGGATSPYAQRRNTPMLSGATGNRAGMSLNTFGSSTEVSGGSHQQASSNNTNIFAGGATIVDSETDDGKGPVNRSDGNNRPSESNTKSPESMASGGTNNMVRSGGRSNLNNLPGDPEQGKGGPLGGSGINYENPAGGLGFANENVGGLSQGGAGSGGSPIIGGNMGNTQTGGNAFSGPDINYGNMDYRGGKPPYANENSPGRRDMDSRQKKAKQQANKESRKEWEKQQKQSDKEWEKIEKERQTALKKIDGESDEAWRKRQAESDEAWRKRHAESKKEWEKQQKQSYDEWRKSEKGKQEYERQILKSYSETFSEPLNIYQGDNAKSDIASIGTERFDKIVNHSTNYEQLRNYVKDEKDMQSVMNSGGVVGRRATEFEREIEERPDIANPFMARNMIFGLSDNVEPDINAPPSIQPQRDIKGLFKRDIPASIIGSASTYPEHEIQTIDRNIEKEVFKRRNGFKMPEEGGEEMFFDNRPKIDGLRRVRTSNPPAQGRNSPILSGATGNKSGASIKDTTSKGDNGSWGSVEMASSIELNNKIWAQRLGMAQKLETDIVEAERKNRAVFEWEKLKKSGNTRLTSEDRHWKKGTKYMNKMGDDALKRDMPKDSPAPKEDLSKKEYKSPEEKEDEEEK